MQGSRLQSLLLPAVVRNSTVGIMSLVVNVCPEPVLVKNDRFCPEPVLIKVGKKTVYLCRFTDGRLGVNISVEVREAHIFSHFCAILCEKTPLLRHFVVPKNEDHFTKTGSGQIIRGKHSTKRCVFRRSVVVMNCRSVPAA
jgi:hypothetical protein